MSWLLKEIHTNETDLVGLLSMQKILKPELLGMPVIGIQAFGSCHLAFRCFLSKWTSTTTNICFSPTGKHLFLMCSASTVHPTSWCASASIHVGACNFLKIQCVSVVLVVLSMSSRLAMVWESSTNSALLCFQYIFNNSMGNPSVTSKNTITDCKRTVLDLQMSVHTMFPHVCFQRTEQRQIDPTAT